MLPIQYYLTDVYGAGTNRSLLTARLIIFPHSVEVSQKGIKTNYTNNTDDVDNGDDDDDNNSNNNNTINK